MLTVMYGIKGTLYCKHLIDLSILITNLGILLTVQYHQVEGTEWLK